MSMTNKKTPHILQITLVLQNDTIRGRVCSGLLLLWSDKSKFNLASSDGIRYIPLVNKIYDVL